MGQRERKPSALELCRILRVSKCGDKIKITGFLLGCQGMRRRESILDYFVQKRKGQVGQRTGSFVPDLGLVCQ